MKRTLITIAAVIAASILATEVASAKPKPIPTPAAASAKNRPPTQVVPSANPSLASAFKRAARKGKRTKMPAKPSVRPKRSDNGINLIISSDDSAPVTYGTTDWFWSAGDGAWIYYEWEYSPYYTPCIFGNLVEYTNRMYYKWTGSHVVFLASWEYCPSMNILAHGNPWRRMV
jgi:hypothetical protein